MSILIVGAGIAGLTTAVKIKTELPNIEVVILEKRNPTANTQIAGLRFRERQTIELLAKGNNGLITQPMRDFSAIANKELQIWRNIFPYEDRDEWFGPQFYNGKGQTLINQLRDLAQKSGVIFIEGEANQLIRERQDIIGIKTDKETLRADQYILANGSVSGELFLSTNRIINHSAHELAFQSDLPLVGSTINMIHPFGRCDKNGFPQVGCYETDKLAGATVIFTNGEIDKETTELLADHAAHNQFGNICQRFTKNGGVIHLIFPDGREEIARVSQHYSHLGILTTDGISVQGINNLLTIGDASNLGYWTNHQMRFPGFALTKCLVDAELVRRHFVSLSNTDGKPLNREINITNVIDISINRNSDLRLINTQYLLDYNLAKQTERIKISEKWMERLKQLPQRSIDSLFQMNIEIVLAHRWRAIDQQLREPILIGQQLSINGETQNLYAKQFRF